MYVLRNLKKYTWYEIRVQPFYLTVEGQESNTVRVRTLEDGTYQTMNISLADQNGDAKDGALLSVQLFFILMYFSAKILSNNRFSLQTQGLVSLPLSPGKSVSNGWGRILCVVNVYKTSTFIFLQYPQRLRVTSEPNSWRTIRYICHGNHRARKITTVPSKATKYSA